MNVAASKELSVSQIAAVARNFKNGGIGVTPQYIRKQIEEGKLKARLVEPPAGRTYYMIDEQDFLAWEENRRGTQGE